MVRSTFVQALPIRWALTVQLYMSVIVAPDHAFTESWEQVLSKHYCGKKTLHRKFFLGFEGHLYLYVKMSYETEKNHHNNLEEKRNWLMEFMHFVRANFTKLYE